MNKSTRQAKNNAKQRKQNSVAKHEKQLAVKHAATRAAEKAREIEERRRHALNWTPASYEQSEGRRRRESRSFLGGFGEQFLGMVALSVTEINPEHDMECVDESHRLKSPDTIELSPDEYTVKKD